MAANKKDNKIGVTIAFLAYLALLCYFLFFSEGMGRTEVATQYRYNLTLFREIKRFYVYRNILGYKAFLLNVVGNVVAFMPFGYFVPIISKRCKNPFFTVLYSLEMSLLVEIVQLVFKLGCFDVDDLFLNTLGGCLGYLIYFIWGRSKKKHVS